MGKIKGSALFVLFMGVVVGMFLLPQWSTLQQEKSVNFGNSKSTRADHAPVLINGDTELMAEFPTMSISNLEFDGSSTGYCAVIGNVSAITINNCEFNNAAGAGGLVLINCVAIEINNCTFSSDSFGLKIEGGSSAASAININNCEFKNMANTGIYLSGTTAFNLLNAKIEDGANGIVIKSVTGVNIQNCDIKNMTSTGIKIESAQNGTAANNIKDCKVEKCADGIYVTGSTAVNIQGCKVDNCTGDGIKVESTTACNIQNNEVQSCKVGIKLQASNGNTVSDNTAKNNSDWDIYQSDGTTNTISSNTATKVYTGAAEDGKSPGFGLILAVFGVVVVAMAIGMGRRQK
ncbi:MAG: right-handed parallel beta-helix repeat-containing protein [Thermoplasmata archaeon]